MSRTTTMKNTLATAYGTAAAQAILCSADPGGTGANEISGGSPAYARKAITWGTASSGSVTATVVFDVAAGTTVAGAGVVDSSGNFLDGGALGSVTFASQGTYSLTLVYSQT